MVDLKRKLQFSKLPEGVQHFPGGSNFFQWGSNCLFPIDTHITCNFPGRPIVCGGSVFGLCFVMLLIKFCNHLAEEERAGL